MILVLTCNLLTFCHTLITVRLSIFSTDWFPFSGTSTGSECYTRAFTITCHFYILTISSTFISVGPPIYPTDGSIIKCTSTWFHSFLTWAVSLTINFGIITISTTFISICFIIESTYRFVFHGTDTWCLTRTFFIAHNVYIPVKKSTYFKTNEYDLIIGFVIKVTRQMPLEEQGLPIVPTRLRSPPGLVRFVFSIVCFLCRCCRSLFTLL